MNNWTEEDKHPDSRKFTMIGLTNFSGEPVMCLLILEGKLPNGAIEAGIDI